MTEEDRTYNYTLQISVRDTACHVAG